MLLLVIKLLYLGIYLILINNFKNKENNVSYDGGEYYLVHEVFKDKIVISKYLYGASDLEKFYEANYKSFKLIKRVVINLNNSVNFIREISNYVEKYGIKSENFNLRSINLDSKMQNKYFLINLRLGYKNIFFPNLLNKMVI